MEILILKKSIIEVNKSHVCVQTPFSVSGGVKDFHLRLHVLDHTFDLCFVSFSHNYGKFLLKKKIITNG